MKTVTKILTAFIAASMAIMTSCGGDNSSSHPAITSTGNKKNPATTYNTTQTQQGNQIDTETTANSPAEKKSIIISDDLKQVRVGDIVAFGKYTWNVINKTDDGYTLLSEKCITKKAYATNGDTRWSGSSLRTWLNNEFYNEFSNEEKGMIKRTHISKTDNSTSTMLSPNTDYDTWDSIFLLNQDEAEQVSKDVRVEGSWWWLRTRNDSYMVKGVFEDGSISAGNLVEQSCGVRPALNLTQKNQQEQKDEISNNLKNANVGDAVIFGAYTWIVTNQSKNGCTLLNDNFVARKAYNDNNQPTTWAECTLRTWLNTYFYNEFSDAEKSLIALTHNKNPNNDFGTNGGVDTDDYIFLFSVDEAKNVINSIHVRGTGLLRSPGFESNEAMNWGNGLAGMQSVSVEKPMVVCPVLNIKYST